MDWDGWMYRKRFYTQHCYHTHTQTHKYMHTWPSRPSQRPCAVCNIRLEAEARKQLSVKMEAMLLVPWLNTVPPHAFDIPQVQWLDHLIAWPGRTRRRKETRWHESVFFLGVFLVDNSDHVWGWHWALQKMYGLASLQVIRQALVQREEQDSKIEQRWQAQLKEESVPRSNLKTVLAVFCAKVSACIDIPA